jgi:hypothetical protein
LASTLLAGLSTNVATYIAQRCSSASISRSTQAPSTASSYDVVMEETGSSEQYETWIGRIRMVESGALVLSALAGRRARRLTPGVHVFAPR